MRRDASDWRRVWSGAFFVVLLFASGAVRAAHMPQGADRAALTSLAGTYDAGTTVITVALRDDGVLTSSVPGQPPYELESVGGSRFMVRGLPGYSVEFRRDASGAVADLVSRQPQGAIVAVRRSGGGIERSIVQALVGTYRAGAIQAIVALRPDGVLTYIVPGQPLYELQFANGLRFALKNVPGTSIEFQRNAAGVVTGLISHQLNGDIPAQRVGAPTSAPVVPAGFPSAPSTVAAPPVSVPSVTPAASTSPAVPPPSHTAASASAPRPSPAAVTPSSTASPAPAARPSSAATSPSSTVAPPPTPAASRPAISQPAVVTAAGATKRFTHSGLGFSLDLPADWSVTETAEGFSAKPQSGLQVGMGSNTLVEKRWRSIKDEFHPERTVSGNSEYATEYFDHPQGDAVQTLSRSTRFFASGGYDITNYQYTFYFDIGGKRWTFRCGAQFAGRHEEPLEWCLVAARSFRVLPASATPSPASAAPPAGPLRLVTLVEGPSFELPVAWGKAEETHDAKPSGPPKTRHFAAGGGDWMFQLKNGYPQSSTDLVTMRATVAENIRQGKLQGMPLTLSDFDAPGGQAFVASNDHTDAEQLFWHYWVVLADRMWAFECTEMSVSARGRCSATMRSFQTRSAVPGSSEVKATPSQPAGPSGSGTSNTPVVKLPLLPVKDPPASTRAPATLVARLSSDARLASLPRDQSSYAVKEAASYYDGCDTSIIGDFYVCDCVAEAILNARLRAGFETVASVPEDYARSMGMTGIPQELKTQTHQLKVDPHACVAPEKIARWAVEKARRVIRLQRPTEERAQKVAECIGPATARAYQARPVPDVGYINNLFDQALSDCQKIP